MSRSLPPPAGSARVLISHNDGVATLTMNRARSLNGWNTEMRADLERAFAEVAADPEIRAAVLTGTGRYYCAGVNLGGALQLGHPRALHELIRVNNQALFDLFIDFPKPLVAAINGHAIGAAVTTATLCDAVVAAPMATFSTPFAALGVPAEGCSSLVFPRLMGAAAAERMLGAEGWQPTATEAAAAGLIDQVVPAEDLLPVAHQIAAELGAGFAAGDGQRRFRGPSVYAELKAANAAESVLVADAFLSAPFLKAQMAFLWRKRKRVPAALFGALWATRPAWGRMLR